MTTRIRRLSVRGAPAWLLAALLAMALAACASATSSGVATPGGSQVLASAIPSPSAQSERLSDAEIIESLRAHVEQLVAEDRFSGVVQVTRHGEILFEGAYGWADRDNRIPNTLDTPFRGGSMDKMYLGVSTLQLIQAGKLSFDDKIVDVAPNANIDQYGPGSEKITVYHLLSHTSGLPMMPGMADSLLFEPGDVWFYSNQIGMLSHVVEAVTGVQDYNDYVFEQIFKPAGMVDYRSGEGAAIPYPRRPAGNSGSMGVMGPGAPGGQGMMGPGGPGSQGMGPAGRGGMGASGGGRIGAWWTVDNMQKFAAALLSYQLLDKEYVDMLMTGRYGPMGALYRHGMYSYGFAVSTINDVRMFGHSGSGPGINAILDMYPDEGYVVSILSNYDNGMLLVNERLRLLLSGIPLPEPVKLPTEALHAVAGYYVPDLGKSRSAEEGRFSPEIQAKLPADYPRPQPPSFDIRVDEEGLWVDFGGGAIRRYLPLSAEEFFDRENPEIRIQFEKDGQGQVTGLYAVGVEHFDGSGPAWSGEIVAIKQP